MLAVFANIEMSDVATFVLHDVTCIQFVFFVARRCWPLKMCVCSVSTIVYAFFSISLLSVPFIHLFDSAGTSITYFSIYIYMRCVWMNAFLFFSLNIVSTSMCQAKEYFFWARARSMYLTNGTSHNQFYRISKIILCNAFSFWDLRHSFFFLRLFF